jgi:hypothetical protein
MHKSFRGDVNGKWVIHSCGEVGTAIEPNVFYTGTLACTVQAGTQAGAVSFGTVGDHLMNVAFAGGVVRFTRPLQGVTLQYEGKLTGTDAIDGTFTHNDLRFSWKAVRAK